MADVHDKKTRSYNMSQIKDIKPEMLRLTLLLEILINVT
jgi:G:T-mismatch repair DNA endonuclease (very short patch repair protein)